MSKRIITVFGGSGFLGRHVIRKLARKESIIRVAVRKPELAGFLRPLGNLGQVVPIQTNIRDDTSIGRALEGATDVINLVGILYETRQQGFSDIHTIAPNRIGKAASASGIERLVHVSAIGASSSSNSKYLRSKALGEEVLLQEFPTATIVRPSILFGPGDNFFNKFGSLARILPVLPIFFALGQKLKFRFEGLYLIPEIEAGTTRFQPVYVSDVAEAIVTTLYTHSKQSKGKTYELGGPTVYSFRQLMEMIAKTTKHKRLLLPIPYQFAEIMGLGAQLLPIPPLTIDQVRTLRIDNVVDDDASTFNQLNISPSPLELILPTYMNRFQGSRFGSNEQF